MSYSVILWVLFAAVIACASLVDSNLATAAPTQGKVAGRGAPRSE